MVLNVFQDFLYNCLSKKVLPDEMKNSYSNKVYLVFSYVFLSFEYLYELQELLQLVLIGFKVQKDLNLWSTHIAFPY